MTHAQIAAEFPRFDIPDDIDEQGWYKCRPVETRELAVFRASDQAMRLRNTFEQTDQIVLCFILMLISNNGYCSNGYRTCHSTMELTYSTAALLI